MGVLVMVTLGYILVASALLFCPHKLIAPILFADSAANDNTDQLNIISSGLGHPNSKV